LRSNLIWRDKPAVSQSHTSLSGCSVSGPLFAFFAASWLDSCPAFGFAPLVPLRCSACFLFSAASSAARRGFTGLLSFPPPPLSFPSVRVVPITWCPPSSVPDFEQSAPIRVGDQGKKVNCRSRHRSPPMIHRVLPQVSRRVTCFLCPHGDRYEVYNTCNSPYNSSVSAEADPTEIRALPVHHHLDVRTDCALQVQTLLNVCAVSIPPTTLCQSPS